MNVVASRLVFLAFLALSGSIVYNALYLQDLRGTAVRPTGAPARENAGAPQASASVEVTPPPVSTDLPPLKAEDGASLLVVRAVQRELAAQGFDIGQADGRLNDKTRAAISAYESREGLAVTGIATDELLHHILLGDGVKPAATAATTVSVAAADADAAGTQDDEAATVKAVQQILADLGYAPGTVDGTLGDATTEAIGAFQRDRDIEATGHITPELLRELKLVTGRDLTKTAAKP